MALLNSGHIPDDVWAQVMATRDEIVSGAVMVDLITDAQAVRALMTSVDIAEE